MSELRPTVLPAMRPAGGLSPGRLRGVLAALVRLQGRSVRSIAEVRGALKMS